MAELMRYWGLSKTAPVKPTQSQGTNQALITQAVLTLCPPAHLFKYSLENMEHEASKLTHVALLVFVQDIEYRFENCWMVCDEHPSFQQWREAIACLERVNKACMASFTEPPEVIEVLCDGKERLLNVAEITSEKLLACGDDPNVTYYITASLADKTLFDSFKKRVGLVYPQLHPDIELKWEQTFIDCAISDARREGDWVAVTNYLMQKIWLGLNV